MLCRRIAVGMLLVSLEGCFGVGFYGTARTYGEPVLRAKSAGTPDPDHALPSEVLLKEVGEPDERELLPDGKEHWVYEGSMRWSGMVLWVILPLPLVIPVGHESQTYLVGDGVAISVDTVKQASDTYWCGVIPGPCYSFGCEARHE